MNLQSSLNSLPDSKKAVSVLSGGLDSTVMTHLLTEKYGAENVFALSYDYGQKQKHELVKAKETCDSLGVSHTILDLSILGDIVRNVSANIGGSSVAMPTIRDVLGDPQPKTYVPFRNMILNSLAFSFAEANGAAYVFTGLQVHDEYGYWDTTQKFVDTMNTVAAQNRTHSVQLVAPFSHLSKFQEIEIMKEMGNVDDLVHTLTCYDPNDAGESCGVCPSCSERIMNFAKANLVDPIPYSRSIPWCDIIEQQTGIR